MLYDQQSNQKQPRIANIDFQHPPNSSQPEGTRQLMVDNE
jgi:hypothetical protein